MSHTNRSFFTLVMFLSVCILDVQAEDRFSERFVRFFSPSVRAIEAEIKQLLEQSKGLPQPERFNRSESMGYHSRQLGSPDELMWVEVDLQEERLIDQVAVLPVFVEIPLFDGQSYGFPVRFKIEVISEDRSQSVLGADKSSEDYQHTDGYPLLIQMSEPVRGRYIRMTAIEQAKVLDHWVFAISEILVLRGPLNLAVNCPVRVGPRPGFRMVGWSPGNLTDFQSPLGPPTMPDFSPTNGFLTQHADGPETLKWMQVDLQTAMPLDAIRLLPARPTDYVDIPGMGFPARFTIEVSDQPDFQKKQLVFDSSAGSYPNPGDSPFEFHTNGIIARYVRLTATELRYQGTLYSFSLGEMQVYSNGKNVALNKMVSASDVFDNPRYPRWKPSGLVDGYNSQNRLIELPDWLAGLEERRVLGERLVRLEEERAQQVEWVVVRATAGTFATSGVLVVAAIGFSISYRKRKRRETEELRRQISRDLHDDIGGDLGGILLLSEGVLQQSDLSAETLEDLRDIHDIAKGSSEALRDIVWLIRDERNLGDLTLRLRETAQLLLRKIHYTWKVEPEIFPPQPVPLKVRRHVFFAFKEALINIRRHAEAKHVKISIRILTSKQMIHLQIIDDGKGFDPDQESNGYGLKNLRRRCEALNGRFDITSSPGTGTQIQLVFSLKH